jgi:hypothetical protein
MRFAFSIFAAAAFVAGTAAPACAQKPPSLSGTWVMQPDKSDFGPVPRPESRTDVIDHKEPRLTIKRTITAAGTETTSNLVYTIDGKPYKNMVGETEVTSTLNWDGQTLVMVSTVPGPQGQVTITDRFTLAADGKTMTQARTYSAQGEELKQTMVLARQP